MACGFNFIGWDYSTTADSTAYIIYDGAEYKEITRKEWAVILIKAQPFF